MIQTWLQRPGEPDIWYDRFLTFRDIGAARTIEATYRKCKEIDNRLESARPGGIWYDTAKKWDWATRANDWDTSERTRLNQIEEQRRFEKREYRIGIIEDVLTKIILALEVANLPNLEMSQARDMLPLIRYMLKDLLTLHREEVGSPISEEKPTTLTITADDLIAAQQQLNARTQQPPAASGIDATIGDQAENIIVGDNNEQTISTTGPAQATKANGSQVINIYTQNQRP